MNTATAPERERRCRYLDRRLNRCTSPSLDQDPATPDVCIRHATKIMQLIAEKKTERLGRSK